MEREHQPDQTELTSIHINLEDRIIEFETSQGTVGRLHLAGKTVLYEGQPLLLAPKPVLRPLPDSASAASTEPPSRRIPLQRLCHTRHRASHTRSFETVRKELLNEGNETDPKTVQV